VAHNLDDARGLKILVDDLNPKLMATIVLQITKKLRGAEPKKSKKRKLFDCIAKLNPKTCEDKGNPVVLE